jgi:hypothetical protein
LVEYTALTGTSVICAGNRESPAHFYRQAGLNRPPSLIALATQSSSTSLAAAKPGHGPYNGSDNPIPPARVNPEVKVV